MKCWAMGRCWNPWVDMRPMGSMSLPPRVVTWSRSPPIGFSSANFPIFFYLFLTRSKENFEKKSSGNPKIFGKILCFFSSSSVDFSLFFSFQCFTKKKAAPFAISISPLRTSLSWLFAAIVFVPNAPLVFEVVLFAGGSSLKEGRQSRTTHYSLLLRKWRVL